MLLSLPTLSVTTLFFFLLPPTVLFRCRQRIISPGLVCGHWGMVCIVSPSTGCFCFGLFGLINGKLSELETLTRDGKMVVCDLKGITGCLLWQYCELNTDVFGTHCNEYLTPFLLFFLFVCFAIYSIPQQLGFCTHTAYV